MKFKQLFAAALAAAMSAAIVFSGCTPTNDDSSKNSSSAPESSKSSEASQESDNDKLSEPASSEPVSAEESTESEQPSEVSEESSKPESKITPAVWEVTDTNGNSIYMMGSIHLADADASVMPDYFETAFAKCDSLAVECDINNANVGISALQKFMYTDGTTIKDHVSKESYDKVVEILTKEGQYVYTYESMKPIMWVELVETIGADKAGLVAKYGVDSMLITRAEEEDKEVLEVESAEFQYDLLGNIPDDVQSVLFDGIADDDIIQTNADNLKDLYEKWKTGTMTAEDTTDGETDEELTPEEEELLEQYNTILLYDRNVGMVDKALEYMQDGKKVMFVVGAAHFYGDKGILQLMENAGCTVRRLSADDAEPTAPTDTSTVSKPQEVSKETSVSETDPGTARAA